LLARVGAKNVDAFEALYRMYQPRLGRFLAQMLQRPQLVEEVLNDTMMVVWQTADRFRGSSKPSTWIFAIAYRKPDAQLHQQRIGNALREAMATLSPEHRAVVDLTYFHGMGYRQIAEIVNCPVDTVKTRMFHARRRLKQALPGKASDWL
jgi:RNA polymerase sigma-70 factor (ECF subfamily)